MTLTTPALLFPAISLLLLAYSNRFLAIAQLIRQLHGNGTDKLGDRILPQIENLRKRIVLIKRMQLYGVVSFITCTASMFCLFLHQDLIGEWIFGGSLILLIVSLFYSVVEIQISSGAIDVELSELELRR
ncbi:DUF2721 domain-containing protein [Aeoliella mucimassa]|uniref:II family cellulose-binding protein n=1 Tax=Aeoliella mucimassa TaxID=2527972 RepID=A0A518ATK7_9BACT|nr:DUF2721 domain-containing protein [Aeoliella mucimassa]QDU58064.1 hypothetical protein Pan181_42900 [Aeoliella mucimassa]